MDPSFEQNIHQNIGFSPLEIIKSSSQSNWTIKSILSLFNLQMSVVAKGHIWTRGIEESASAPYRSRCQEQMPGADARSRCQGQMPGADAGLDARLDAVELWNWARCRARCLLGLSVILGLSVFLGWVPWVSFRGRCLLGLDASLYSTFSFDLCIIGVFVCLFVLR